MQAFSTSWHSWSGPGLSRVVPPRTRDAASARVPDFCGWYDSSFDLAQGLLVVEQDSDSLYQLWELSLN
ncbi:hypothetical protein [Roseateles sp.]|uniref:hypothetical protein n=1 Tax=Roseateles sp. TaxID=1971397 RepID=UPI0039EA700B